MATWADFYPELMPHVVGCPNPTANIALRESARAFFRRTRTWREWLEPEAVMAGVREYDLPLPSGAMVVRIERCTVDGVPMDVLSHKEQLSDFVRYEQPDRGLLSRDRAGFVLTQLITPGAMVAAEVSLMPTKTGVGIPDDQFAQHAQDIVEGAKHRLMLIPQTPFYNEGLAAVAMNSFELAVAAKTVEAWKGATGAVPHRRARWC